MALRAARNKKTTAEIPTEEAGVEVVSTVTPAKTIKSDPFVGLIRTVSDLQSEFERLQEEIARTKESWSVEQKAHVKEIGDRNTQEELDRKRNQETYEYETARKRKQAEDEFADKKASWEKQLKDQQETLDKEKTELSELRKLVVGFESEKEKAISIAQEILQKELIFKFETERKLKEQENKSEKDILNLRIGNLTTENSRLTAEIEVLKKTLEGATRQVKDIAVKVIESGTKPQLSEVNSTN